MVTIHECVECPITDEINTISLWMAERRILYEYPGHDPDAFGAYDESHIPSIQKGIIGELITFDYLLFRFFFRVIRVSVTSYQ